MRTTCRPTPFAPSVCLFVWLAFCSGPASARLRITVSGADFQPIPIAVPQAEAKTAALVPLAGGVTELLRLDIDMARHFSLVPPSTYLAAPVAQGRAFDAKVWRDVGASGVIETSVAPTANGASLSLAYFDAHRGQQALARQCEVDASGASRCVHEFLDELVKLLTGEEGIFSTRIAFVRQEGRKKTIWTCDVDGQRPERTIEDGSLSLLPAWDPSGTSLLYTGYASGRAALYRRAVNGGAAEVISAHKGLNMGAAVSPDGKKVAMTLSFEGNAEIYVAEPNGRGLTRLTQTFGQDVSPTWGPDGKRIAFISSRSGAPHLYVMNADGSEQKRLTFQGKYIQEPDWSPRADGRIVFTARDEHLHYDLFSIAPEGGHLTRLTQDSGDNDGPAFAPDGRHIVFTSTRGADHKRALYIMDDEGRKVRRLGANVSGVETPAWGPKP